MIKQTLEEMKTEREKLDKSLAKIKRKIDKELVPVLRAEFEGQFADTYWSLCNGKNWFAYVHVKAVGDVWTTIRDRGNCNLICDICEERPVEKMIIFEVETHTHSPGYFETPHAKKITKYLYEKKKAFLLKKLAAL